MTELYFMESSVGSFVVENRGSDCAADESKTNLFWKSLIGITIMTWRLLIQNDTLLIRGFIRISSQVTFREYTTLVSTLVKN